MNRFLARIRALYRICPVTFYLISLNTIFFVLTLLTGGFTSENLIRLGALVPAYVTVNGDYFRILTSMFLHGNVFHFLSNMLALYFLGVGMERCLGPLRYLILYFLSGIGGAIAILLFGNPLIPTIGASAALYGIMAGMLAIVLMKRPWFTPGSARSIWTMMILNFVITFVFPSISILGHIGGFVVGLILAFFLIPKIPYFVRYRPIVDNPIGDSSSGEDDSEEDGPVS
jgi:rhomboid protease GluP